MDSWRPDKVTDSSGRDSLNIVRAVPCPSVLASFSTCASGFLLIAFFLPAGLALTRQKHRLVSRSMTADAVEARLVSQPWARTAALGRTQEPSRMAVEVGRSGCAMDAANQSKARWQMREVKCNIFFLKKNVFTFNVNLNTSLEKHGWITSWKLSAKRK